MAAPTAPPFKLAATGRNETAWRFRREPRLRQTRPRPLEPGELSFRRRRITQGLYNHLGGNRQTLRFASSTRPGTRKPLTALASPRFRACLRFRPERTVPAPLSYKPNNTLHKPWFYHMTVINCR